MRRRAGEPMIDLMINAHGRTPESCRRAARYADGIVIIATMGEPTPYYRRTGDGESVEIDPRGPDAPAWLRARVDAG